MTPQRDEQGKVRAHCQLTEGKQKRWTGERLRFENKIRTTCRSKKNRHHREACHEKRGTDQGDQKSLIYPNNLLRKCSQPI